MMESCTRDNVYGVVEAHATVAKTPYEKFT